MAASTILDLAASCALPGRRESHLLLEAEERFTRLYGPPRDDVPLALRLFGVVARVENWRMLDISRDWSSLNAVELAQTIDQRLFEVQAMLLGYHVDGGAIIDAEPRR